ncbi:hypothetical protein PDIDSM_4149 [Penicillium digitatum]|nr:hypothetical protein PDIDSM_4149 [Penicillium digitatum]
MNTGQQQARSVKPVIFHSHPAPEGEKRALATEAFQPVIETLERMEQEDPKLATQAARLVGLYRRLWESCISKHHAGQILPADNNELRITNTQMFREIEYLKQQQNNQIARLTLFEEALGKVREGIVGVLKDWDGSSEEATSVSWEGAPLGGLLEEAWQVLTAWVTGPTAQSNRNGIEAILNEALDWERRGGATCEVEKTAITHFAPKAGKVDQEPFIIKGQTVEPKGYVKILGIIMDTRLKYKKHIARAASKGLEEAMELRRLCGLSPAPARQLFTATMAPAVEYASNFWMHAFKNKIIGPINRVQRVGAQGIVGIFLTVATSVAEAEAHIATVQRRLWRRAAKMWTDMHTLPVTNPLRRSTAQINKFRGYQLSRLYQVADALKSIEMESLETINPFTLAPWEERVQGDGQDLPETQTEASGVMRIAVSSSARNKTVAFGVAVEKRPLGTENRG